MKIYPKDPNLVIFILLLGVVAVLGFGYLEMQWKNSDVQEELLRLEADLQEQRATSERLGAALLSLAENLNIAKSEQDMLRSNLQSEKQKSSSLAEQLGQVSGTVQTLEKLKNTDEELLQKYSKIYFLNEHYVPARLGRIDPMYVYDTTGQKDFQIHSDVLPFLNNLLNAAEKNGVSLLVVSAYRSFNTQEVLKHDYTVVYGAGTANQFSADQGYSEHQLGTTVDFTTPALQARYDTFENTPAFAWLKTHAHLQGFTLSYPKNNIYYQYEPWHWRFVGHELAKRLYEEGNNFYDLDQREIDKYLVSIFD